MTASKTTGTYFYSPDIKIFVKSSSKKDKDGNFEIIDVSEDITNFSITRQTNSTSNANFTLVNKGWKYTLSPESITSGQTSLPIETMDQVVIYLKRDTYLQYFTGYITNAPIVTLVPQPVTFEAQCTIYKIQNSFWDVNNLSFQSLMPGMLMASTSDASKWGDGGAAQGIVNVLSNVVGIPLPNIHVASIPSGWIANAAQTYNFLINTNTPYVSQDGAQTLMQALDGAGIISGNNLIGTGINKTNITYSGLDPTQIQAVTIPNGVSTNAVMAPGTLLNGAQGGALGYTIPNGPTGIIAQTVSVKDVWDYYSNGSNKTQPVSADRQDPDYWCVISWPYFTSNIGNAAEAANWLGGQGSGWDNGRPILVTSIANAKQVVVKASIAGNTANNIVLSRAAWEYLAGTPVTQNVGKHKTSTGTSTTGDFYLSNNIRVTLAWADPTKVHEGPQDTTTLVSQLQSYGYSLGDTLAQGGTTTSQTVNQGGQLSTTTTSSTGDTNTVVTKNTPSSANNSGGPPPWNKAPISPWRYDNSTSWAHLCLLYGGFPNTDNNAALINLWITLENADNWACYYNPLGDTDTSLGSAVGRGGTPGAAFQSLDAAAQWWGYKMNTSIYWAIGAVFDSRPRYSNGTYTPTKKYDSNKKLIPDIPLPSANTPGAPKDLGSAINIFKTAVQACPWDGGHYKNKAAGTWGVGSTNPRAYTNPGIWVPTPYGTWKGGPASTGTVNNPANGNLPTTATNTGTNFNITFQPPQIDQNTLALIGTPRAFVTDQPVLQSVATMVQSSLRQFQSAPNGDFLAWFPDYFGLYGQAPSLSVHDIEIIDFTIYHDDTKLVTHIAVSGDQVNLGTSVGLVDWMQSNGIISVQIPEIMAILFGFATADSPNATTTALDALYKQLGRDFANNFLARYGMRPLVQEQPMIRSHVTEFMYAWQLFMQSWANQYSSTIRLSFMPELYPGMRIRLEDHGIEVYVQSVQHQGDRASGFYTIANVTCPVYRKTLTSKPSLLHYGFPPQVG